MLPNDLNSQQQQNFERYKERLSNFSNEFELGLFLYITRKNLKWIFIFLTLSFLGAFIYIRYTPPLYKSSSVIQIRNDNKEKKILEFTGIPEESGIDVALELIRSKYLFTKAIEKLNLHVTYYNEGQILTELRYPNPAYYLYDLSITDSSIIGYPIDVKYADNTFTISYKWNNELKEYTCTINDYVETPHFKCRIILQDEQALLSSLKENRNYFVINDIKSLAAGFYLRLTARILNASANTIEVIFENNNLHLCRDVVNALTNTYIEYDLEQKKESSQKILAFIDAQIDTVYAKLKNSEDQIQAFRQINKVKDFKGVADNYLERLSVLESDLLKEEIDEKLLNEIEVNLNKNNSEADVYNMISILVGTRYENPLSESIKELQKLLLSKEKELFSVTKRSEVIKSLDYQIDIQIKVIKKAILALKEQIQKRKSSIKDKIAQYENIYYGLPEKEVEYARLERLFNINEKYHTLLVEKKTEYSIALAGQTTQNQILEEAKLPSSPISPKKKLVYISFFVLGMLISLITIVVKYLMHNNITSLHEITKASNASINIIGLIPKYKLDIPVSQLIIDKNPKSIISEAFRTVRTNLQFISNEPGPKVVSVTSTISGEGKTFTAINLAGIIAFTGKKVIILDVDMRKPKIHIGFNVSNDAGMSTLLIGKSDLQSVIRNSHLPNLDFITAGPIPPNPSELIINGKIEKLIEELKTKYDVIIFDTPPVGLVTDGLHLIQLSDYPIYVFRANYSKRNFVQNADRLINENKITNLSVILNGVDTEKNTYGYNYGYGYGYGYGYAYEAGYYTGEEVFKKKKKLKDFFKK
jgi:capsular exopolysaccharide synthesis family protein